MHHEYLLRVWLRCSQSYAPRQTSVLEVNKLLLYVRKPYTRVSALGISCDRAVQHIIFLKLKCKMLEKRALQESDESFTAGKYSVINTRRFEK